MRLRHLALGGWILVVALATAGLHQAGHGLIAPPALAEPGTWPAWLAARDPVVSAVALLRLAALAAAWYLLVVSVVGAGLRLGRARRLVLIADRVTLPALRRLLVTTAGLTLASGLAPGPVLARSTHPPAVVTSVAHPQVTTAAPTTTVPGAPPTVTMRLLTPEPEPGAVPALAPPPPLARSRAPTWTVRSGECFWSIAEEVLAQAWGRAPTDAEIVPYWRVLIEENRGRLGDRANPDLIWVGQVFGVPTPPPRAA